MFEAYKIGIRLTLLNGVSSGLLGLVTGFQSLDRQVSGVNRKLTETERMMVGIKRRLLVGGAMTAVGGFGMAMAGKTIPAAKEYAHQLALMNEAGMTHIEIVKATQAAWEAGRKAPTSSVTENMAAIRDLRMVFGDTGHAMEFMPIVQQAQAILQNLRHGEAGSGRAEAYEMAKALEMKGAVKTPSEFIAQADAMVKALVSTGGKVSASDFLSAFKYGRQATAGWDQEFTYKILPTLIQEMKSRGGSGAGGGPGSALMSAYAAVVGGTVPQKALHVWQKLGLLDSSKIIWDKVGGAKGVAPGGIKGSESFQANPYQWAQTYLIPALQKAGYMTEVQQRQALQYLFPNRTAGFVMSQFVTQAWKFERDRKMITKAQGLEGYNQLLKTDPEMAQMALHKQWQSLLAILGFQIMPALVKGMSALIGVLQPMGAWFSRHQFAAKALMVSLIGLSGALFVGGAGLSLCAAFSMLGLALRFTPLGGVAGIAAMGSSFASLGTGASGVATGIFAIARSLMGPLGLVAALGALAYVAAKHLSPDRPDDGADHSNQHWERRGRSGKWVANSRVVGPPRSSHQEKWVSDGSGLGQGHWDTVRSTPAQQTVQVQTQINLDGRKVADVVSEHQAKSASRPVGGTSGIDYGLLRASVVGGH